jgi:hypothetical protein
MGAKAFLLLECTNVQELLAQTLRYEYGLDGSREFFEECANRLEFIRTVLNSTAEADVAALSASGSDLIDLAGLICRIERSSLGEYSWPFVEELKKIAIAICTEPSLLGGSTPPKVYVLADGGLTAYAIYPETKRVSASKRLILTIVFPKSLKHFVLLHPILGHEVGHAIWRCSKHQGYIQTKVLAHIKEASGKLSDRDATRDHIFATTAPSNLKTFLDELESYGINQGNLFSWASWDAWIEEILCDLIGLAIFGPGFVAAHCELLYGLDPSGYRFGPEHPPVAWRVNMILKGASILGFDEPIAASDPNIGNMVQQFWSQMHAAKADDCWYDVFTNAQLAGALSEIRALVEAYPPSAYIPPSPASLEALLGMLARQVPPVGFTFDDGGRPELRRNDFRHTIYAGWVIAKQSGAIDFDLINRLCQHGIMQQGAIDRSLNSQ